LDYLPLSQGDSTIFQVNGFASFAGQTKKSLYRGKSSFYLECIFIII
jgi:hypothetical protein